MDAADRLNLLPPDKKDVRVPERILSAIQNGELEKGRRKDGAAYALAHNPCSMLSDKLFYAFGRDQKGTADRIAAAFCHGGAMEKVIRKGGRRLTSSWTVNFFQMQEILLRPWKAWKQDFPMTLWMN